MIVCQKTRRQRNLALKFLKVSEEVTFCKRSFFSLFIDRDNYGEQLLKRQQLIFTTTICLITSIFFVDWFAQQNEFFNEIKEMEREELNKCFRKFYMSARKQDGSYYNKSTLTSYSSRH